jgi:hypothetical protein
MAFVSRRPVLAGLAVFLAAGPAFAGTLGPGDPTAPVAALYAVEKAGRPALGDAAERAATLTGRLAALYDRAKAVERATNEEVIDFDAVTNSQGAEVKSYALKVEQRDATHAVVVATIDPGDWARASPRENIIRFTLVVEQGRWRIDDIAGVAEPTAWSLRDIIDHNLRQK